jgi:hypothetical protein
MLRAISAELREQVRLEEVPDWDSDAIQFGQIGRTLWFL